jgi:hypothetical protein
MNDIREIWSLPWHVLQRNLAEAIGFQGTAGGGAAREAAKSETAKMRDAERLEDSMLGQD